MRRLAALNRTTVFILTVVVTLAGFFLPGIVGALVLAVVVIGMAALLRATWPVTAPGMRVARAAILALLAIVALWKLLA